MEKLAREKIANQQKLVNLKKDSSGWDQSVSSIILSEQIVKVDIKPKSEGDHVANGKPLFFLHFNIKFAILEKKKSIFWFFILSLSTKYQGHFAHSLRICNELVQY